MSEEQRNDPPGMSSGDPLGGSPPPEQPEEQQSPAAPQPPPAQPVEDLGSVMGTGAFAVPVPEDVEGHGPPSGGQAPQPPPDPPTEQQPLPPAYQQPPAQPPEPEHGQHGEHDPFGRPWPGASQQASHDPFGRPVQPEAPPPAPPQPAGDPLGGGAAPGGFASGDPLGGSPGGFAPPQSQAYPPPSPPGGYAYPPPAGGGYAPGQAPPGAFPPAPPAGSPIPGQFTLAGWGSRLGAYLIDVLVIFGAALVAAGIPVVIGALMIATDSTGLDVLGGLLIALGILVYFVIAIMYAPYWMAKHDGQTVGKKVLGIRVVRVDGGRITLGFGLLREIAIKGLLIGFAGALLFYIPVILNYLWPLWDDENRALHDMVAKSRVVDA